MAEKNENPVKHQETILEGRLTIEKAEIHLKGEKFERMRLHRPPGAAVLVYNRDKDCLILTRQFRYPIHDKSSENIIEIMAGIVDEGEDPLSCAVREAEEEIGYKLRKEDLKAIASCFVSPGYTSEMLHLFYCETGNAAKTDKGGGLSEEQEDIEIVEISRGEFERMVREQAFRDFKTLLAGYWFLQNG